MSVYWICGCKFKLQDFNVHKDRVDELLFEKMATPRFPDLWVIVEKLLLLLLGQASLKRGFSINRNIEEKNLKVESFIPQRHICDFVYSVVGLFNVNIDKLLKGCVHYIFASLFCKSKTEHLWNKEKYFLFSSKALFVLEIIKF